MDILTQEQKRILKARAGAGQILKHLGLTTKQRREWLDRHADLNAEELSEAIRREFGKPSKREAANGHG